MKLSKKKMQLFFVMPRRDGTLTNFFQHISTLDLSERLAILGDIANELFLLHEKAIIHRNLHSRNILCYRSGAVCSISDFGLSIEESDLISSGEDEWLHYDIQDNSAVNQFIRPPEARGGNKQIGYFTDVYAFGIIMLEVIIGKRIESCCDQVLEVIEAFARSRSNQLPKSTFSPLDRVVGRKLQETAQLLADFKTKAYHALEGLIQERKSTRFPTTSVYEMREEFDAILEVKRMVIWLDLMQSCLQPNPVNRPSAFQVGAYLRVMHVLWSSRFKDREHEKCLPDLLDFVKHLEWSEGSVIRSKDMLHISKKKMSSWILCHPQNLRRWNEGLVKRGGWMELLDERIDRGNLTIAYDMLLFTTTGSIWDMESSLGWDCAGEMFFSLDVRRDERRCHVE
eukprot:TRINITY_DN27959_c0_g2_i2.p1 TRINITY_DN27959_c0_g2~~TRINITY_DN27959_c0_g2_i2.p1  ORF type:complete len:397 (-),score=71.59 TRINITY_DN27959_c0_g2_i2:27-1217(-)